MARKKAGYLGTLANPDTHLECPWNDHGAVCGKRGSLSESLNGAGPWYCTEHFWRLRGWEKVIDDRNSSTCAYSGCTAEGVAGKNPFYCVAHYGHKPSATFRERWYAEKGLPYELPNSSGLSLTRMPKRQREPGEDDEEVAA